MIPGEGRDAVVENAMLCMSIVSGTGPSASSAGVKGMYYGYWVYILGGTWRSSSFAQAAAVSAAYLCHSLLLCESA